jgi:hypothetical protein
MKGHRMQTYQSEPEQQTEYFLLMQEYRRQAARIVLPLVVTLLEPTSVIDVGCAMGAWLSVFQELGVKDIVGIDAPGTDTDQLLIPQQCFLGHDLRQPLHLGRTFDLVVSLEVAEHLPPECAESFVQTLVELGPAVLFSAAIPLQGGSEHLNEQWQEYWANLFHARGYLAIDCVRRHVWNNPQVHFWYAQNTLLYVRPELLASIPHLAQDFERTARHQLSLVHPTCYLRGR